MTIGFGLATVTEWRKSTRTRVLFGHSFANNGFGVATANEWPKSTLTYTDPATNTLSDKHNFFLQCANHFRETLPPATFNHPPCSYTHTLHCSDIVLLFPVQGETLQYPVIKLQCFQCRHALPTRQTTSNCSCTVVFSVPDNIRGQ